MRCLSRYARTRTELLCGWLWQPHYGGELVGAVAVRDEWRERSSAEDRLGIRARQRR